MENISDYALVQESLKGNEGSFSELVRRYKNLVFATVYKILGDYEESLDLSQEIFVKIYNNLWRYSPKHKFSTWVITIATNRTIDFCRKRKVDTVPIENSEYYLSQTPSAESTYLDKERSSAINKALLSLPDKYLTPIIMYHNEGMKYTEISEALGLPLSMVKNRIYRGRKLLKEILEKEGKQNGLF